MTRKVLSLRILLALVLTCIFGIIFSVVAIDKQIDSYIEEMKTDIVINNNTDLVIDLKEEEGQMVLTIDENKEVVEKEDYYYGIVTSQSGLNIREEATLDSDKIGTFYYGAKVRIIEDCGDWYKTDDGYIFKEFVLRI